MAPAQSKPVNDADAAQVRSRKRLIEPAIYLKRPLEKEYKKDGYLTCRLRTQPENENSPVYELNLPYFKEGSPEELLIFLQQMDKVIVGQNLNTPAQKYSLARRIFLGEALTAFEEAVRQNVEENNENFVHCLQHVVEHIFPARALISQKRYMRRFMRKPKEMSIRNFMARLTEINAYLNRFPPFQENQELPLDEIMDIAEFAVPARWQRTMVVQDFDCITHTPMEFVKFCEKLEMTDESTEDMEKSLKQKSSSLIVKTQKHKIAHTRIVSEEINSVSYTRHMVMIQENVP